MISPGHIQLMARYNRWQNQNLYSTADTRSDGKTAAPISAQFTRR